MPTNCLSVFDHFVRLMLKVLTFETVTSVSQIPQPRETIMTKVRAPKRLPEGVNVTQFNEEGIEFENKDSR